MALKVGDKAPDFTMYDLDKKPRTLREFLGKKTVIVFYPGAFTGVCTKEICTFRDSLAAFNTMNAQVIAASTDSPFANKAFADQNKLTFTVLSDVTKETANEYCGVYEAFAGIPGYQAAKRSVFVLDAAGSVKYAWISENPGVEPNYDEVRNAVNSF
ncbi:MAG: redoxin domain-containing protein [Bacteroidota bacterium]